MTLIAINLIELLIFKLLYNHDAYFLSCIVLFIN